MASISILFGGIFFLVLLVGVLVFKRRGRWVGLLVGMGVFGSLALVANMPPLNPTLESVSGTYEGTFGGGKNTFVLRPDGTFDQHFVSDAGKVYKNQGTWIFDEYDKINFSHFLDNVGDFGKPQKPVVADFNGATLRLLNSAIYFSEDEGIMIERTKR